MTLILEFLLKRAREILLALLLTCMLSLALHGPAAVPEPNVFAGIFIVCWLLAAFILQIYDRRKKKPPVSGPGGAE